MKSVVMVLGGVSLAIVGMILWDARQRRPVAELAHDLELAWADHRTVV